MNFTDKYAQYRYMVIRCAYNIFKEVEIEKTESLNFVELKEYVYYIHRKAGYITDEDECLELVLFSWWKYKEYFTNKCLMEVIANHVFI